MFVIVAEVMFVLGHG